ncbi:hypothetical protein MRX96_035381 [Rhipicephalus microplus]
MLWRGSRNTNFAGVLNSGLCITPQAASVNGCMFEKGVYFGDCVSKSANCCFRKPQEQGLKLLCEVSLGNIMEEANAKSYDTLPKGIKSIMGVDKFTPNRVGDMTMSNGVMMALWEAGSKWVVAAGRSLRDVSPNGPQLGGRDPESIPKRYPEVSLHLRAGDLPAETGGGDHVSVVQDTCRRAASRHVRNLKAESIQQRLPHRVRFSPTQSRTQSAPATGIPTSPPVVET